MPRKSFRANVRLQVCVCALRYLSAVHTWYANHLIQKLVHHSPPHVPPSAMNSSVYVAEERSPSARSKAGIARRQYASKAISCHGRFAVLLCVLVSFLLFAHPTQAWLRSDIPPNNANRSLTRISIPRTYSLTESEMKKLSKQESKVLGQDDFALLAFTSTAIDKNDIRRAVIVLHGQG